MFNDIVSSSELHRFEWYKEEEEEEDGDDGDDDDDGMCKA